MSTLGNQKEPIIIRIKLPKAEEANKCSLGAEGEETIPVDDAGVDGLLQDCEGLNGMLEGDDGLNGLLQGNGELSGMLAGDEGLKGLVEDDGGLNGLLGDVEQPNGPLDDAEKSREVNGSYIVKPIKRPEYCGQPVAKPSASRGHWDNLPSFPDFSLFEKLNITKLENFCAPVFEQYFAADPARKTGRSGTGSFPGMNIQAFAMKALNLSGPERERYLLHGTCAVVDIEDYRNNQPLDSLIDVDSALHLSIRSVILDYSLPEWFKESLTYFAFPNRVRSITKNVHLSVNVNGRLVKVSNIPNFEIATFGTRGENHLVIFFPRKQQKKNGIWVNNLDSKSYEIFYDNFSRPALLETAKASRNPIFESMIPFSYSVCEAKCNIGGRYAFSGITIPGDAAKLYFESLRRRTQGSAFDDFFFIIYAKGWKMLLSPGEAKEQLEAAPGMDFWLQLGEKYPGQTFFDVACTFHSRNRDSMPACIFLAPEAFARKRNNGAHKSGAEDIIMLLEDLKGFRCETKEIIRKRGHIIYAQLYSTEKVGVIGSIKQSFVRSFSMNDVLANSGRFKQAKKIVQLCWPQMAQSSYSLRFEIRISYFALQH